MRVLAAADKFKGTATAAQVCAAIGHACWALNIDCTEMPMADGGEGTLAVLGGANRTATVTGPLGTPVEAQWRLHRGTAVIEMAQASGLTLAGGPGKNDPLNATTRGTGELIDQALNAGAKKIIVCLGGSATTDGGLSQHFSTIYGARSGPCAHNQGSRPRSQGVWKHNLGTKARSLPCAWLLNSLTGRRWTFHSKKFVCNHRCLHRPDFGVQPLPRPCRL
jgi:hypothetical protein